MEDRSEHVIRLVFKDGYTRPNPSVELGVGDCIENLVIRNGRVEYDAAGHGAVEGAIE